ncbi:hypothetical protein QBC44DRAFT_110588 [Cladorrhinum sp. PSN332]|nr:hypothetical protein QBC44DRAFT_110588 [Cladorrhinum sp. PSN332]
MKREPRRRSPESSRRRRAQRRTSREQLAAAAAAAVDIVASPSQTTPTQATATKALPPQPLARSRADSTTSTSSSTSSSFVNISRPSRFGIRSFFASSSVKKVKKRRSFRKKNSSSSDSDLAYGRGYISRSSFEEEEPEQTDTQAHYQQLQHQHPQYNAQQPQYGQYPPQVGYHSQYPAYSPHQSGYPPPPSQQYGGYPPPLPQQQPPPLGPDGRPILKRAETDEEIIALGRKLSDLARAENIKDLERIGKTRPSRVVGAVSAYSEFRRKNSELGNTNRGIGFSKPAGHGLGEDTDWESASDSDSSDTFTSDSDSGLAYGSMPRFSDPQLAGPPVFGGGGFGAGVGAIVAGGAAGAIAGSVYAGSVVGPPTIISERPSEAMRPPDRKPSAVDPAMFGPVNSLRGYVNTPCGFRPGDYQSPVSTVHPYRYPDDPIPKPDSASNEARPLRNVYPVPTADPSRYEAVPSSSSVPVSSRVAPVPIPVSTPQPSDIYSRPEPVPIQAPKPRIPVSPRVLEERNAAALSEREVQNTGSPNSRRQDREGRSIVDSVTSAVLPAVIGAAGGAILAEVIKDQRDDKRDERRYERHETHDKPRHDRPYDKRNDQRDDGYQRHEHDERRDNTKSEGRRAGETAGTTIVSPRGDEPRDDRHSDRSQRFEKQDRRDYDKREHEDRYSQSAQPKSDDKPILDRAAAKSAPAVVAAVGGPVLAQPTDKFERDQDELYRERERLEKEVQRHRDDSERHAREERQLREDFERREKELRDKAEQERQDREKREWMEEQERRVREDREKVYKQERRADDRSKVDHDRRVKEAEKRDRDERRKIEARDTSRDKAKDREREERHRAKKDIVLLVDDRDGSYFSPSKGKEPVVSEPVEKPADSLTPSARRPNKEERRKARDELRRMLEEAQKELDREKERQRIFAELEAAKEAAKGTPKDTPKESPEETPKDMPLVERPEPESSRSQPSEITDAAPVDPFQFQVPDDAFPTPTYATPARPLTPQVHTVEREPEWARLDPEPDPDGRLSRRDSYENELRISQSNADEGSRSATPPEQMGNSQGRERSQVRSPSRQRGRDREPVRDLVQEEADRYYREQKMADKIAEEEIRTRSVSPAVSVVDKYDHDDMVDDPVVRIVTPPEMKRAPKKSKFDGPDADVRIDNHIMPHDMVKYQAPPSLPGLPAIVPIFKSRDRSCERERPMIILVYPTPSTSPSPEKGRPRDTSSGPRPTVVTAEPREEPKEDRKREYILDRRSGQLVEAPEDYNKGRAPEPEREHSQERPPLKFKFKPGKVAPAVSGLGAIVGLLARKRADDAAKAAEAAKGEASVEQAKQGEMPEPNSDSKPQPEAGSEPAAEVLETVSAPAPDKARDSMRHPTQEPKSRLVSVSSRGPSTPPGRSVPFNYDDDVPPPVGRKPPSPGMNKMPGGFVEEDIEFTAALAAGLESTGFDPNIVIDDPAYRKRGSPFGSNEPIYVKPSVEAVPDPGVSALESSRSSSAAEPHELPQSKAGLDKTTKDDNIPGHNKPPDPPRESRAADRDARSIVSDPIGKLNGSHAQEGQDTQSAVSPLPSKPRYTNGTSEPKEDSILKNGDKKQDSFLGNAGTSGAGAGQTGAVAEQPLRPNAAHPSAKDEESSSYSSETVDPEVLQREIKPAIDPEFHDLLLLPPSEPGSPVFELEDEFPPLPDSRPETPPGQRVCQKTVSHVGNRSLQESSRAPSPTAVPVKLLMKRGSVPSSPVSQFSFLAQPPARPYHETMTTPKRSARPTSWEGGQGIMPIYLIESLKASSSAHGSQEPRELPGLPPSEPPSSRESPAPDVESRDHDVDYVNRGIALGLDHIQADFRTSAQDPAVHHQESGQTTPRGDIVTSALPLSSDELGALPLIEVDHDQSVTRQPQGDELMHLPALPESQPESPVEDSVFQPPARRLFSDESDELPALPESPAEISVPEIPTRASFGEEQVNPQTPSKQGSKSFWSGIVSTVSSGISSVLPSLPLSRPASPVAAHPPSTGLQLDVSQPLSRGLETEDQDNLPALPTSTPESPVAEPDSAIHIPDTVAQRPDSPGRVPDSAIQMLDLPVEPFNVPVQPQAVSAPQVSSFRGMTELPPLPESPPASSPQIPVAQSLPRSPVETVDELPPLPESLSTSAAGSPIQPPLAALDSLDDVTTLPALPDSRPDSPAYEVLGSANLAHRPLEQPAPAPELAVVPSRGLEDLPPLPENRPASPTEAVSPETSQPLAEQTSDLPPLPESDPPSPAQRSLPDGVPPHISEEILRLSALEHNQFTSFKFMPSPESLRDVMSEAFALPLVAKNLPMAPMPTLSTKNLSKEPLDEASHLPPLPESQPMSPEQVTGSTGLPREVSKPDSELRPLPESQPMSPEQAPKSESLSTDVTGPVLELPSAPENRAISAEQKPVSDSLLPKDLVDDVTELPPLPPSLPMSPEQQPLSQSLPKEVLDQTFELPPLPESEPVSPEVEELVPKGLPREVMDEILELPPLPESEPASPVQPDAAENISGQAPNEDFELPLFLETQSKSPAPMSLPESFSQDILDEIVELPPLPESQPPSPAPLSLSDSLALQIQDEASGFPLVPEAWAASPVYALPNAVDDELTELPPLPESQPMSPAQSPMPEDLVQETLNNVIEAPSLPDIRPVSPVETLPQEIMQDLPAREALAQSRSVSPSQALQQEITKAIEESSSSQNTRPASPVPIFSQVLGDIAELPALPESRPLSPIQTLPGAQDFTALPDLPESWSLSPVETLERETRENALTESLPIYPAQTLSEEIIERPAEELVSLPPLPESRPISPVQPASQAALQEILDEPTDLPPLPDSQPMSPVQHVAQQVPCEIEDLPALPESRPASPDQAYAQEIPRISAEVAFLPVLSHVRPTTFIQTLSQQTIDVIENLPALPESQPLSPVDQALSEATDLPEQFSLSESHPTPLAPAVSQGVIDDLTELPALPETRPVSPAQSPVQEALDLPSEAGPVSAASDLPPLPDSRPISRAQSLSEEVLGVSTQMMQVLSDSEPVLSVQTLPSANDLAELPALPESVPTSSIETLPEELVTAEPSSLPRSLPVAPAQALPVATDFGELPALPESLPISPVESSTEDTRLAEPAVLQDSRLISPGQKLPEDSQTLALSESQPRSPAQIPFQGIPDQLTELPALPESRPISPGEVLPSQAVQENTEEAMELPPLPESRSTSPVQVLSQETRDGLTELPSLAESRPISPDPAPPPQISRQIPDEASELPALTDTWSMSRAQEASPQVSPQTPAEVHALSPRTLPGSAMEMLLPRVSLLALDEAAELPPLPESRPTSPIDEPSPQPRSQPSLGDIHDEVHELPPLPENRPSSPPAVESVRLTTDPQAAGSAPELTLSQELKEFPALPESRPDSPTQDLISQPLHQEILDEGVEMLPTLPENRPQSPGQQEALESVVQETSEKDFDHLPTLPESRAESPTQDLVPQTVLQQSTDEDAETLPAIPESRSQPGGEKLPLEAPMQERSDSDFNELPALPESRAESPAQVLVAQPMLEQLSDDGGEALPALLESRSHSLVQVAEVGLQETLDKEFQNMPGLPESHPQSPVQESAIKHVPEEEFKELVSLPAFPDDHPDSPLQKPMAEPVLEEQLKKSVNLPALPESRPESPVQEELVADPALEEPLEDSTNLPALPESRPESPVQEELAADTALEKQPKDSISLPALPESRPESPLQEELVADPALEEPLEDSTNLPALPESRPESPLQESVARPSFSTPVRENIEKLPALTESRPESPLQEELVADHALEEQLEDSANLPALPESRSESPVQEELAADIALETQPNDSVSLSALPESRPELPLQESVAGRGFNAPVREYIESLPALPESRSDSPAPYQTHEPFLQQSDESLDSLRSSTQSRPDSTIWFDAPESVLQKPSDQPSRLPEISPESPAQDAALESALQQPFDANLDGLPPLPESLAGSPVQQPAVETELQESSEDVLESLPALPESHPDSPITQSKPEPLIQDLSGQSLGNLPTLPESRPDSPFEQDPRETVLQQSLEDSVSLPPLPSSRADSPVQQDALLPLLQQTVVEQGLVSIPSLLESRPSSPSPILPEDNLNEFRDLPPLPESPSISTTQTLSQEVSNVSTELPDIFTELPALPESAPESPLDTASLEATGASLDQAKSSGKGKTIVQVQDFAEASREGGAFSEAYQPPGTYEELKRAPSPISHRAFEKAEALEADDKGKAALLATAAGASSGILVAHMLRDGPEPDVHKLGHDLQMASHEPSESGYSLNDDAASTVAASEAPTYLSGSTFYETQPESFKRESSPRQEFGFLFGNRLLKSLKAQPTSSLDDKNFLGDTPATQSTEDPVQTQVPDVQDKKEATREQLDGTLKRVKTRRNTTGSPPNRSNPPTPASEAIPPAILRRASLQRYVPPEEPTRPPRTPTLNAPRAKKRRVASLIAAFEQQSTESDSDSMPSSASKSRKKGAVTEREDTSPEPEQAEDLSTPADAVKPDSLESTPIPVQASPLPFPSEDGAGEELSGQVAEESSAERTASIEISDDIEALVDQEVSSPVPLEDASTEEEPSRHIFEEAVVQQQEPSDNFDYVEPPAHAPPPPPPLEEAMLEEFSIVEAPVRPPPPPPPPPPLEEAMVEESPIVEAPVRPPPPAGQAPVQDDHVEPPARAPPSPPRLGQAPVGRLSRQNTNELAVPGSETRRSFASDRQLSSRGGGIRLVPRSPMWSAIDRDRFTLPVEEPLDLNESPLSLEPDDVFPTAPPGLASSEPERDDVDDTQEVDEMSLDSTANDKKGGRLLASGLSILPSVVGLGSNFGSLFTRKKRDSKKKEKEKEKEKEQAKLPHGSPQKQGTPVSLPNDSAPSLDLPPGLGGSTLSFDSDFRLDASIGLLSEPSEEKAGEQQDQSQPRSQDHSQSKFLSDAALDEQLDHRQEEVHHADDESTGTIAKKSKKQQQQRPSPATVTEDEPPPSSVSKEAIQEPASKSSLPADQASQQDDLPESLTVPEQPTTQDVIDDDDVVEPAAKKKKKKKKKKKSAAVTATATTEETPITVETQPAPVQEPTLPSVPEPEPERQIKILETVAQAQLPTEVPSSEPEVPGKKTKKKKKKQPAVIELLPTQEQAESSAIQDSNDGPIFRTDKSKKKRSVSFAEPIEEQMHTRPDQASRDNQHHPNLSRGHLRATQGAH